MTVEELIELIRKGPIGLMLAAVAPLTDTQRKKLSKTAVELRKEQARSVAAQVVKVRTPPAPCPFCGKTLRSAGARQCFECGKDWHAANEVKKDSFVRLSTQAEARLKLALMAVGPWGETQRLRVWHLAPAWNKEHEAREYLFKVLRDRRPDWLAQWIDKELADELADWRFVRQLVRTGLCPKPQTENYILKMLSGMHHADHKKSLQDRLLEDPELLADEVWRIFELSPARETILSIGDIAPPRPEYPCFSWAETLRALAAAGKLDRQRLLAASLGSLLRNSEARNTAWFCKFHELLEPTEVERQRLQAGYVQLLSHPVPSVVAMVLDALAVLEKAQKLDVPSFLDAVAAVFHLQPKAQPLAALKILRRSYTRDKSLGPKLGDVLLSGLTHPAAQVQEAIVELLGELREQAAEVIATRLPNLLEALAPSVQEQARTLLVGQVAVASDLVPPSDDIVQEARLVPSPWREQAGIDAVLQALDGNSELTAAPFDPMSVPHLDPAQRVEPIQSLDELLERLTVAVEAPPDAIEFELLLDGLSRHCDQRPDDFQARLAPLVLRVQKLLPHNPGAFLTIHLQGLRAGLFKLILRWCEQEAWEPHDERDTLLGALEVRIGVLILRIRNRQAAPLIACPTHRRGWIDPEEMARRFAWYQQRKFEPSVHDVIQGLLRLAPDGRANTLAGAGGLHGKFAPAFRYALGGPLEDPSSPSTVLITAGRARAPFAELAELHSIGESLGPDASHPARYSWKFIPFAEGTKNQGARLYVNVEPPLPAHERIRDLSSVLLHTWRAIDGVNRWAATVWPANLQSFFASGARLRLEVWLLRQRADYLEPLFDPDVPFTEIAQVLLALALNQAEPEVAGLAEDVLIELIRDGRCVGPELGSVLRSMLPWDVIKLNRLGKHLETVARASLLHAHVCARIAQTACGGLTEIPKDLHNLLSPLLEWLTVLQVGVSADFRPMLETARSGKTGTLAKKLLQLPSAPGKRGRVLVEALEERLQRVARWRRCAETQHEK